MHLVRSQLPSIFWILFLVSQFTIPTKGHLTEFSNAVCNVLDKDFCNITKCEVKQNAIGRMAFNVVLHPLIKFDNITVNYSIQF